MDIPIKTEMFLQMGLTFLEFHFQVQGKRMIFKWLGFVLFETFPFFMENDITIRNNLSYYNHNRITSALIYKKDSNTEIKTNSSNFLKQDI